MGHRSFIVDAIVDGLLRRRHDFRGEGMYPQSSVSRQFVASPGFAGMGPNWSAKRSYIQMYGLVAVIALPMVGVFVLGNFSRQLAESASIIVTILVAVGLVLFIVGWIVWYGRNNSRRFNISVAGSALTVDKRPGDVYQFSDARLGLWGMNDATMGTVLHLHSGPHRFVLGGREHRIGRGTRLDEPPIVGVDAFLTAQEFDELLRMMGRNSGLDVRPVTAGGPVRCLLFPNALQAQQMGAFATGKQRRLLKAASHASLAIDVDAQGIRVIDPRTNAQITSARNGQWTATPETYQYRGPWYRWLSAERFLTFAFASHLSMRPEIVINLAGMPPLRIAGQDAIGVSYFKGNRFAWRGDVPQRVNDPAEYSATGADWQILVEKFGLAPYLEIRG